MSASPAAPFSAAVQSKPALREQLAEHLATVGVVLDDDDLGARAARAASPLRQTGSLVDRARTWW